MAPRLTLSGRKTSPIAPLAPLLIMFRPSQLSPGEFDRLCRRAGYGDPKAIEAVKREVDRRQANPGSTCSPEEEYSEAAATQEPEAAPATTEAEDTEHALEYQNHVYAMRRALASGEFVSMRMAIAANEKRLAAACSELEAAKSRAAELDALLAVVNNAEANSLDPDAEERGGWPSPKREAPRRSADDADPDAMDRGSWPSSAKLPPGYCPMGV